MIEYLLIKGDIMSDNFWNMLNNAIRYCEGDNFYNGDKFHNFKHYMYPFTTENINGYIDLFDLRDRSLMCVGSSGDQVINAIGCGCRDINVVDINPFCRYYYYLKMVGILCLELDEFLYFFKYKDYPDVFKENYNVFDRELFNKIKVNLRYVDFESYLFWDELFSNYNGVTVRKRLFSYDEERSSMLRYMNRYLSSSVSYYDIRNLIKKVNPVFIQSDLFDSSFDRYFDNIWLSNVCCYLNYEEMDVLFNRMKRFLNDDGMMLFSYLYDYTDGMGYDDNWKDVYNFNKIKEMCDRIKIVSFSGVNGIKFGNDGMKDSVLVYKKKL